MKGKTKRPLIFIIRFRINRKVALQTLSSHSLCFQKTQNPEFSHFPISFCWMPWKLFAFFSQETNRKCFSKWTLTFHLHLLLLFFFSSSSTTTMAFFILLTPSYQLGLLSSWSPTSSLFRYTKTHFQFFLQLHVLVTKLVAFFVSLKGHYCIKSYFRPLFKVQRACH